MGEAGIAWSRTVWADAYGGAHNEAGVCGAGHGEKSSPLSQAVVWGPEGLGDLHPGGFGELME